MRTWGLAGTAGGLSVPDHVLSITMTGPQRRGRAGPAEVSSLFDHLVALGSRAVRKVEASTPANNKDKKLNQDLHINGLG